MERINFTKKQLTDLEKLTLSQHIISTEADLYIYHLHEKDKILKIIKDSNPTTINNKIYTALLLKKYQQYIPKSFCLFENIIQIDNQNKGFMTKKIEGITLSNFLKNPNIPVQEHIFYLKEIGFLLQQLSKIRKTSPLHCLYINDLNESNFIVDWQKKKLYTIDLDSCKIMDNANFPARYLTKFSLVKYAQEKYQVEETGYHISRIIADENSDLHCYIIVILNYLLQKNISHFSQAEYYEYLNYLNAIGVNPQLLDIFSKILTNENNQNPLEYLDYLTEKQIHNARYPTYQKKTK